MKYAYVVINHIYSTIKSKWLITRSNIPVKYQQANAEFISAIMIKNDISIQYHERCFRNYDVIITMI